MFTISYLRALRLDLDHAESSTCGLIAWDKAPRLHTSPQTGIYNFHRTAYAFHYVVNLLLQNSKTMPLYVCIFPCFGTYWYLLFCASYSFFASAKTGDNVAEAFHRIVMDLAGMVCKIRQHCTATELHFSRDCAS
jgi:hypothetical protein